MITTEPLPTNGHCLQSPFLAAAVSAGFQQTCHNIYSTYFFLSYIAYFARRYGLIVL
jgi:hypothetical protein